MTMTNPNDMIDSGVGIAHVAEAWFIAVTDDDPENPAGFTWEHLGGAS